MVASASKCSGSDKTEVQCGSTMVASTSLGFKRIPECATLDSRVSDQGRICDFIYPV